MKDEQIRRMLRDVTEHFDFDVWKDLFDEPSDEEFAKQTVEDGVHIVRRHLEAAGQLPRFRRAT